jgi:hypothetical protein
MLHPPLFSEHATEYIDASAAYQINTEEKRFYSISPKKELHGLPSSLMAGDRELVVVSDRIATPYNN